MKKKGKKGTIFVLPRVHALGLANVKTKEAKKAKSVNGTKKSALSTSLTVPLPFFHKESVTAYNRLTG